MTKPKRSSLESHISKMENDIEHYRVVFKNPCREHNAGKFEFCRCGYPGVGAGKLELHAVALEYESEARRKKSK